MKNGRFVFAAPLWIKGPERNKVTKKQIQRKTIQSTRKDNEKGKLYPLGNKNGYVSKINNVGVKNFE